MPYTRDIHVKDELGDKNCGALSKDGVHMVTCSEPKAGYICEIRTGKIFGYYYFGLSFMTENRFNSTVKTSKIFTQCIKFCQSVSVKVK